MKILVVDDEQPNRDLLAFILNKFGECKLAVDGPSAINAYRQALDSGSPFDLVTLDVMMPDMNGHETLEQIRAVEEDAGIDSMDGVKIIMISANCDYETILRSFDGKCMAYIEKPIIEENLVRTMTGLGLLDTDK